MLGVTSVVIIWLSFNAHLGNTIKIPDNGHKFNISIPPLEPLDRNDYNSITKSK